MELQQKKKEMANIIEQAKKPVVAAIHGNALGGGLERTRQSAEWIVGALGMLQTIPSIALGAFMIPLLDNDPDTLRAIYDRLDGLFVAGGVDVDPASYGEPRDPLCGRTDLPRDAVELTMARWALDEGKPFFGMKTWEL